MVDFLNRVFIALLPEHDLQMNKSWLSASFLRWTGRLLLFIDDKDLSLFQLAWTSLGLLGAITKRFTQFVSAYSVIGFESCSQMSKILQTHKSTTD